MTDEEQRRPTTKLERVCPPSRRTPDEELAAVDEALSEAAPETSDHCPVCASCSLCRGTGLVTAAQKAAYRELTKPEP